ncbi:MAG: hypothetical protein M3380_18685, partial [Chloroflexota bacterium]|nr:hypothetical protein [Chloroflexota bacterium]
MYRPYSLTDAFEAVELLLRIDDVQLARSALAAIAAVAPDSARFHFLRGWIALDDGDMVLAAKQFRLALGRDPLDALAWHGLATALPPSRERMAAADRAERFRASEAAADLWRGKPYLARAPLQVLHTNHPDEHEWTLLFAECLRRLGEIDGAREVLAPQLDRVPVSAPAALLAAALDDDPSTVFSRLREAARGDPAWISAYRLWAPDGPPIRLPPVPE